MTSRTIIPSHQEWESETKRININTGISMAYMEAGDPINDTILFVHGFSDSGRIWRLTMEQMVSDFHLLSIDLRGAGQTDKPEQAFYTTAQHAEDIAAFLEKKGLDNVYVIAHSMGTMIAQAFAFSFPEKVKKLFLAAPMVRGLDSVESLAEQYEMYETMKLDKMAQSKMQEQFLPYPENCQDPDFPEGYFTTLRQQSGKALRAAWQGVHLCDHRKFTQFIKVPVFIIWGDQDTVLAEEYQSEVKEAMPNAYYRVIKDISHEIPNEIPDQVAEFATEFFQNN